MRLIVGTYRKRTHIARCLRSVDEMVRNVDDVVFVDDSGDQAHRRWLAQYGNVVSTGDAPVGYGPAMQHVCDAANREEAMFLEEDFTFVQPVDLRKMSDMLHERPHLAQLALLRGPHFPVEHQHGGVIEALEARGHTFTVVRGVVEHTATFTCNPAVWRGAVYASGWPQCRWSEDQKAKDLLAEGYTFGYLPGIRVQHNGERSGFGY